MFIRKILWIVSAAYYTDDTFSIYSKICWNILTPDFTNNLNFYFTLVQFEIPPCSYTAFVIHIKCNLCLCYVRALYNLVINQT